MRQPDAAAVGVVAAVTAYVVERHYLQVEWTVQAPLPVLWWVLGAILGVVGMPLLLTALGRGVERQAGHLIGRSWWRLLTEWVLPLLAAHVVWLGLTLVGLRRFNPGFTGIPARDVAEILPLVVLPPPELSLLWSLALAPVVAKLARRLPTGVVIVALAGLTLLTTAPTFLVFLLVGMRLGPEIGRLAETTTWRSLLPQGAVALVGASVLGVPRFPDGLGTVVAGLAVLPFALTLLARLGSARLGAGRRPSRGLTQVGTAAVAIYLLQIPVVALFDRVLLARLGHMGPTVQYPAALVEPLVIVAVVVGCGVVATVLVQRAFPGTRRRHAARKGPDLDRSPVLAEVDR
ncbi:hypothetical protein C8K30_11741 [Promicromonospora sp. AC04]|uniref:hypothetical protein n=1 Tax=Promicromonospora sp. AC04 TaxID=2135723 RepID=UPI000D345AC3|nr:hypothetical protein [Promicromonospora sp. AC04]PUB20216.1 hypothetical protein C8K30_11741 [Promicromonospora sp. AC04]